MNITEIPGGVCAPAGFVAAGLHCGIAKTPGKKDLALIYSEASCGCAGVFTRNLVQAAPIQVSRQHMADGRLRGVICNSGNANACTGDGEAVALAMCRLAAERLGIGAEDLAVASTGVIGQSLPIAPIEEHMDRLVASLSREGNRDCARAMMTTDTVEKEIAVSFELGGKTCKIGGVAKGSGMIHPNMGTMLAFVTTDAAVTPILLQKALGAVADRTFNMVSVDGDTSTNDTLIILSNGLAGNPLIDREEGDFDVFVAALEHVCRYLARTMAGDGEGATKQLECTVSGARDEEAAKALSKGVIASSLFKAAMFGADANWGRVLCAMGYAGVPFDPAGVDVGFASRAGEIPVCKQGAGLPFDEELAKKILSEKEIQVRIALREGTGHAVAWGCDLTYDYVKINGDYRS